MAARDVLVPDGLARVLVVLAAGASSATAALLLASEPPFPFEGFAPVGFLRRRLRRRVVLVSPAPSLPSLSDGALVSVSAFAFSSVDPEGLRACVFLDGDLRAVDFDLFEVLVLFAAVAGFSSVASAGAASAAVELPERPRPRPRPPLR
ncbi:MAG: hypothetical protein ACRDH9_08250, partial [Actinomycetota bacterium]